MSKPKDANTIYDYDIPTVRQKARCGNRNWIIWWDRNDQRHAAVATRETLKKCLLDTGTGRGIARKYLDHHWFFVHAGCGTSAIGYWAWGCVLLRNLKYHGKTGAY